MAAWSQSSVITSFRQWYSDRDNYSSLDVVRTLNLLSRICEMFSKRFYCLWPTVTGSYKPERDCSCTMRQQDIFDPLLFAKEDAVVEEVISKDMTKKEQYKHADELAIAKSDGCAPTKRALCECMWSTMMCCCVFCLFKLLFNYLAIRALLLTTLQSRSQLKTSLSDRSVTLFNFHSTRFADHLIQRNIRSLVIVESAHVYARKAKICFILI
uniref:Uncharacterized protein n=1 Tax=Heterorhabditis bacteriophora TaxID=37862 RepID=A0A1I7X3J0_HETBA